MKLLHLKIEQKMNKVKLGDKNFRTFINSDELTQAIDSLAKKINIEYANKAPVFICVLNGSFMFAAELIKRFNYECSVTFIKLSSYDGVKSSGSIDNLIGLNENITEKDVIIVEDIVDSGLTVESISQDILKSNPRSLEIATLLFKPKAYKKKIRIKYPAIEVGNEFLVGFGLDYNGLGRNLKEIYIIE